MRLRHCFALPRFAINNLAPAGGLICGGTDHDAVRGWGMGGGVVSGMGGGGEGAVCVCVWGGGGGGGGGGCGGGGGGANTQFIHNVI